MQSLFEILYMYLGARLPNAAREWLSDKMCVMQLQAHLALQTSCHDGVSWQPESEVAAQLHQATEVIAKLGCIVCCSGHGRHS